MSRLPECSLTSNDETVCVRLYVVGDSRSPGVGQTDGQNLMDQWSEQITATAAVTGSTARVVGGRQLFFAGGYRRQMNVGLP